MMPLSSSSTTTGGWAGGGWWWTKREGASHLVSVKVQQRRSGSLDAILLAMSLSRRDLLIGAASTPLIAPLNKLTKPRVSSELTRVILFTDAHIPTPNADDRVKYHQQKRARQAFKAASSYKPDFWVFGGDNIMAVDQGQDEKLAMEQFDNWEMLVREEVGQPHASVIGNHDIWYPKGSTPDDRKALAKKAFQMPNRYHKAEIGGWSFFMLDVFHPGGPTEIDAEQWSWLDEELGKTSQPACVVSHTPIIGPCIQIEGGGVGGTKKIRELFLKHDNVRLALSGHQHHVDYAEYDRVTYICGGAVSAGWWGGNYSHFPPAFVVLDLSKDGYISNRTVYWETPLGEDGIVGGQGYPVALRPSSAFDI